MTNFLVVLKVLRELEAEDSLWHRKGSMEEEKEKDTNAHAVGNAANNSPTDNRPQRPRRATFF